MESDTLAYDGDAEAWAQWQVPLPPPAATHGSSVGASAAMEVAADAPTLNYELDEPSGTESFSAGDAMDSSEYPGVQGAVSEGPTLAYDTQMIPAQQGAGNRPTLACSTQMASAEETMSVGPTLAYDTQMIPTDASEYPIGNVAAAPPNASATVEYETQMLSDPASALPDAAATLAYETQFLSDVHAMPETQMVGELPPSIPPFIRHEPQRVAVEPLAPTLAYGETQEIGPTLAYGEDELLEEAIGDDGAVSASPSCKNPAVQSRHTLDQQPAADISAASAGAPAPLRMPNKDSTSQHDGAHVVTENASGPRAAACNSSESSSRKRSAPSSPARSSVTTAATAADVLPTASTARPVRRVRLSGKQPPRGWYAEAAHRAAPVASTTGSNSMPSTAHTGEQARGSQAPPRYLLEMGTKVSVRGDGWGGGHGEYMATVTEADSFTFTVIRQINEKWEETHVLREHCTVLGGGANQRQEQRS